MSFIRLIILPAISQGEPCEIIAGCNINNVEADKKSLNICKILFIFHRVAQKQGFGWKYVHYNMTHSYNRTFHVI